MTSKMFQHLSRKSITLADYIRCRRPSGTAAPISAVTGNLYNVKMLHKYAMPCKEFSVFHHTIKIETK